MKDMKDMKGGSMGPISAGEKIPLTKRTVDLSHDAGVAMHPGFDEMAAKFSKRTRSKHKAYKREPIPDTP